MWALSGVECGHSQCCVLASCGRGLEPQISRSGQCCIARTLRRPYSRELELMASQGINFVYPDDRFKVCKHNRNVASGHSQEPSFVAQHRLKACKTQ